MYNCSDIFSTAYGKSFRLWGNVSKIWEHSSGLWEHSSGLWERYLNIMGVYYIPHSDSAFLAWVKNLYFALRWENK
jgi:hypothetical protein